MLRDVLVTSIMRGQVPVTIAGIIVVLMILRMPREDVGELTFRVIDAVERRWVAGYVLAALFLVGWCLHARYQRKAIAAEMDRLSAERTELQHRVLGSKIRSREEYH